MQRKNQNRKQKLKRLVDEHACWTLVRPVPHSPSWQPASGLGFFGLGRPREEDAKKNERKIAGNRREKSKFKKTQEEKQGRTAATGLEH